MGRIIASITITNAGDESKGLRCDALAGYITLGTSQAGVDMLGHRLVPIKHPDLK
jgi:hypothetical protein